MLTTTRKQIHEKVICSPQGVLFRVWFVVEFNDGVFQPKIINAVAIGKSSDSTLASQKILAIKGVSEKVFTEFALKVSFYKNILSPYSSLILFNGSKPRAPTFA